MMALFQYTNKKVGSQDYFDKIKKLRIFFISSKNKIQISVREENIPCQESMSRLLSYFLNSFKKILIHVITSELINKFVVIDLFSCVVSNHIWIDNNLFFLSFILWNLLYLWLVSSCFGVVMNVVLLLWMMIHVQLRVGK